MSNEKQAMDDFFKKAYEEGYRDAAEQEIGEATQDANEFRPTSGAMCVHPVVALAAGALANSALFEGEWLNRLDKVEPVDVLVRKIASGVYRDLLAEHGPLMFVEQVAPPVSIQEAVAAHTVAMFCDSPAPSAPVAEHAAAVVEHMEARYLGDMLAPPRGRGERYAFGQRLRYHRDGERIMVWYCGQSANSDGLRVRFADGTVHSIGPMEVTL